MDEEELGTASRRKRTILSVWLTSGRAIRIGVPLGVAAVVAIGVVGVNAVTGERGASAHRSQSAGSTSGEGLTVASRARPRSASATLRAADGSRVGSVRFERQGARTVVNAKLTLSQGMSALDAFHGFHIHANDKPENGQGCLADPAQPANTWFASADGHLAEAGAKHSHHTGDLPSLLVNDDGTALIEFTTTRLDLADLQGRAVVVHAGADNFANVPTGPGADQYNANSGAATDKTAATGNAGDRIACGVITVER